MCFMCHGGTIKDVLRILNLQIIDWGFAIVPVGTRTGNKGWTYAIGLIDSKSTALIANNGKPVPVPNIGGSSNFLQELLERLPMPSDMRVRTTEPHLEM